MRSTPSTALIQQVLPGRVSTEPTGSNFETRSTRGVLSLCSPRSQSRHLAEWGHTPLPGLLNVPPPRFVATVSNTTNCPLGVMLDTWFPAPPEGDACPPAPLF